MTTWSGRFDDYLVTILGRGGLMTTWSGEVPYLACCGYVDTNNTSYAVGMSNNTS